MSHLWSCSFHSAHSNKFSLLSEIVFYMHTRFHTSLILPKNKRKLDMVVHTCNPCTLEVKTVGWRVGGHPWLCSEFQASPGYRRSCLKIKSIKQSSKQKRSGACWFLFRNPALWRLRLQKPHESKSCRVRSCFKKQNINEQQQQKRRESSSMWGTCIILSCC